MKCYKDYGWEDNSFTSAHKYIIPSLIEILKDVPQPILDIGCGNGAIANFLISKGYEVYGIDASESGINLANKINAHRFYIHNIESDKELPIELINIAFKTIISIEVIEHLYSPKEFISFCYSTLKKSGGGYLILSTPYHGYLKNLFISLFNKWDVHFNPLWEGGHIKFWSRKTLYKLLYNNNFEIINFKGAGRLPYLWKSMIIKAYAK